MVAGRRRALNPYKNVRVKVGSYFRSCGSLIKKAAAKARAMLKPDSVGGLAFGATNPLPWLNQAMEGHETFQNP